MQRRKWQRRKRLLIISRPCWLRLRCACRLRRSSTSTSRSPATPLSGHTRSSPISRKVPSSAATATRSSSRRFPASRLSQSPRFAPSKMAQAHFDIPSLAVFRFKRKFRSTNSRYYVYLFALGASHCCCMTESASQPANKPASHKQ